MGFYIRKSVSAGPFRFNLSGSGVGLSVGVRGFRIGTGPRGHYVHMGRGGLYYRASLDGPGEYRRTQSSSSTPDESRSDQNKVPIETGNVLEMAPSKAPDIV